MARCLQIEARAYKCCVDGLSLAGQLAVSGDSSQALDLALLQSAAAAETSSRIGDASPQNR